MTPKEALEIGMQIAHEHEKAALDIYRVEPSATPEQMLRGVSVWLGTKIMRALLDNAKIESKP